MKFDEPMDFVQMRDGSSYVGSVISKTLQLKTSLSDKPFSIATDKMVWIIFRKKDGGFPLDRVQMKDASELVGTIQDKTIAFESDATGKLDVPTKKILAIQFLSSFGDHD